MKRIAIFCDGTWNGVSAPEATNVMEVAKAVLPKDKRGIHQQVMYLEGVGTGNSNLLAGVDKITGGAFGWGLLKNVREAYKRLIFSYQPGDEIYLFGFSRGAYTARSLLGLIRSCGILERQHIKRMDEAIRLYRYRGIGSHPNQQGSLSFRRKYSGHCYINGHDVSYRESRGDVGLSSLPKLSIEYVGVWDTVGALGVPNYLGVSRLLNGAYRFHDVALSSMVKAARHAVAIDENRRSFAPSLWDNLTELEAETGNKKKFQQAWFPGDHGSVGGGGEIKGLSNSALLWVAEGAPKLALDPRFLAEAKSTRRVFAPLMNRDPSKQSPKDKITSALLNIGAGPRKGPLKRHDPFGSTLSFEAQTRLDNDKLEPAYRPPSLAKWHETPPKDRYFARYYQVYGDEIKTALTEERLKRLPKVASSGSDGEPRYYHRFYQVTGETMRKAMRLPPQ